MAQGSSHRRCLLRSPRTHLLHLRRRPLARRRQRLARAERRLAPQAAEVTSPKQETGSGPGPATTTHITRIRVHTLVISISCLIAYYANDSSSIQGTLIISHSEPQMQALIVPTPFGFFAPTIVSPPEFDACRNNENITSLRAGCTNATPLRLWTHQNLPHADGAPFHPSSRAQRSSQD